LKSKDPNDGTEEALLNELRALDEHLKANVSKKWLKDVGQVPISSCF